MPFSLQHIMQARVHGFSLSLHCIPSLKANGQWDLRNGDFEISEGRKDAMVSGNACIASSTNILSHSVPVPHFSEQSNYATALFGFSTGASKLHFCRWYRYYRNGSNVNEVTTSNLAGYQRSETSLRCVILFAMYPCIHKLSDPFISSFRLHPVHSLHNLQQEQPNASSYSVTWDTSRTMS